MNTDPLGEAIGRSEPAQPFAPGTPAAPGQAPPPGPQGPPASAPGPESPPSGTATEPERPLLERRPEILVGAALAGGFVAAQVIGRIRGR